MQNMDSDGGNISHVLSKKSLFSQLHLPGNIAFEAFSCISKITGALFSWLSHGQKREISSYQCCSLSSDSSSSLKNVRSYTNFSVFHFNYGSKDIIGNMSKSAIQHFVNEAERLHSCSVLSLAFALIPSFHKMPMTNGLAMPLGIDDVQHSENIEHRRNCCHVGPFQNLERTRQTVEPRTGIEFPMSLKKNASGLTSEVCIASSLESLIIEILGFLQKMICFLDLSTHSKVLVAMGSRTMKIIRIKSLKIYAFGFYVHPSSVCQKLGPKYASLPACELDNCDDLYKDLLREDVVMSVRLVVNYNGLKINTVRDVFEKSLRARLLKANPKTTFDCLNDFGSFFTQDIPIPAGTIIDFRRTSDGQLITEIGGNMIGSVRSKDLCRAFFGMYIGDVPVSEQTKEEIGRNVVGIIKRC
ncbi:unnamed protein product [Cochlearia groenlandica]